MSVDCPYKEGEWDSHPFMYVEKVFLESGGRVDNIIENTPAVKALLTELINPMPNMYTTIDICHYMRLIKALTLFWC